MKAKSILSLGLAAVMALSTTVPAFASDGGKKLVSNTRQTVVFAKDRAIYLASPADVQAAKDALEALKADTYNIAQKVPTDEAKLAQFNAKLEKYNAAVNAWKALSEEQKDAMDVTLATNLFKEVAKREGFVTGGSTSGTYRLKVSKEMSTYLGPQKSVDDAMMLTGALRGETETKVKLSTSTKFTKDTEKETLLAYVEAYKNASELVRMYADATYSTYGFYNDYEYAKGARAKELAQILGNYYEALSPSDVVLPQKPNKNDYEGGAENAEYLKLMKAYCDAEAKMKNHLAANVLKGIEDVAGYATEFKTGNAPAVIKQMIEAVAAFNADRNIELAEAAAAAYDKLNEDEQYAVKKLFGGLTLYYCVEESSWNGWQTRGVYGDSLYDLCVTYVNFKVVAEFEAYIAGIKFDEVTNTVVAESKEKYEAVPSDLRSFISDATMDKYNTIQNMYEPSKPIAPSMYKFDKEIAEFVPTKVWQVPTPAAHALWNTKIAVKDDSLALLIKSALAGSVKDAKNFTMFTNANMTKLLALYEQLGPTMEGIPLVGSGIAKKMKPSGFVKDVIPEEKFAGAAAKIAALAETDDTYGAFAALQFENGDWGFRDGDKEGFRDAVITVFRPLGSVIGLVLGMPNSVASNGDYTYGDYEKFIPIFEDLGLKGVISSEEFTERYNAAAKGNEQYDVIFGAIATPVINLIDDIMKNPLETILDLLPRLGVAFTSGSLNREVHAIIDEITGGFIGGLLPQELKDTLNNLDLTADGVNKMIDGKTITFDIGKNAAGTITLKAINWAKLAGCGKAVAVPSVRATNAYRFDVVNGRPETYITARKYIVKAVFTLKLAGKTETVDLLNIK